MIMIVSQMVCARCPLKELASVLKGTCERWRWRLLVMPPPTPPLRLLPSFSSSFWVGGCPILMKNFNVARSSCKLITPLNFYRCDISLLVYNGFRKYKKLMERMFGMIYYDTIMNGTLLSRHVKCNLHLS